jgi:hypothetical protein
MDYRSGSGSGPCSPSGTGTVQKITDPDPGGQNKTYGSETLQIEQKDIKVPGFVLSAAL